MIQVQRFNKVLKLAVILGDLVILNVLFISFNSIWNELFGERACSGTLPQILTLFSVCYFACTISGGVILHRRGARADQIVFRVLRNGELIFLVLWGTASVEEADRNIFPIPMDNEEMPLPVIEQVVKQATVFPAKIPSAR